jgi:hypothetical protein
VSELFGFEHHRCVMFLDRRPKNPKLLRSGMFSFRQAACRSYGARNLAVASRYKPDAPMALDLQGSRRTGRTSSR